MRYLTQNLLIILMYNQSCCSNIQNLLTKCCSDSKYNLTNQYYTNLEVSRSESYYFKHKKLMMKMLITISNIKKLGIF